MATPTRYPKMKGVLRGSKAQRSPAKGAAMNAAASSIAARNRARNAGPRTRTAVPAPPTRSQPVAAKPTPTPRRKNALDNLTQLPNIFKYGK